jgi:ABC-type Zn uptake system ZnuABC Zn-binding protein ZnuA
MRRRGRRGIAAAALLAAGIAGFAAAAGAAPPRGLLVATTVAPITSIVANIGGDRVRITGIVPEGTNSHTFEPRPSVAELLSQADVVYLNGLVLEEPTKRLAARSLKEGAALVELGTRCIARKDWIYDFSFPRSGGKPNPHLWTNPRHALCYARVARDDLSRRDPANRAYYAGNYRKLAALVAQLDRAMRASFATIPRRVLLTYHDAYAYFARDYGWKVIGAIQVSDFEDPTPREVARLIEQVRRERVPAIFGSEVFPSPVLEQIGRETGVRYVDVLRDDDLPGKPGEPRHSWAGLMHFDYVTITRALGGDATALERFRPRNVVPDRAVYPQ